MRRAAIIAGLGLLGLGALAWLLLSRGGAVIDPPRPPAEVTLDPDVQDLVQTALARVRQTPRRAEAWGALAMVYHANGLGSLAETCYGQALALDDDEPRWWYGRGTLRAGRGRAADALADLSRAVDLDPGAPQAWWRRGYLHLDDGGIDEAADDFRRALERAPNDPAAAVGLARVELMSGDARAAAARLEAVRTVHPNAAFLPHVHGLLAAAYRQLGDPGRAQRHAALTTGEKPAWPDAWLDRVAQQRRGYRYTLERAEADAGAGRVESAISALRGLLLRHPDDPVILNLLQSLYAETGRLGEAIELLEGVVTSNPQHAVSHLNLSHLYERTGNSVKATRHVDAALEANPTFGAAHLQKGRLLTIAGQNEAAVDSLEAAFRFGIDDVNSRIMLGRLQFALGRFDAARSSFEAVLPRAPDHPSAWTGIAAAMAETGPLDEARTALTRAQQLRPREDYDRRMLQTAESRLRSRAAPGADS